MRAGGDAYLVACAAVEGRIEERLRKVWLMGLKVGCQGRRRSSKTRAPDALPFRLGGDEPTRNSGPCAEPSTIPPPTRKPSSISHAEKKPRGGCLILCSNWARSPGRKADCTSTGLRRFGQLSTSTFATHPCFYPFHSGSAHFLSGSDSTAFVSNGRHRQPRSKVRWPTCSLWLNKPLNVHLVAADHAQALSTDLLRARHSRSTLRTTQVR